MAAYRARQDVDVGSFPVPQDLLCAARKEHREDWLERVPARVAELAGLWALTLGSPFEPGGQTAWVALVRDKSGRDVVMKVMWRHPEATHEADGLREWDGNGTVRVFAVAESDDTIALLIERCRPGTTLAERREPEQDIVIANLLRRLWRPEPSLEHRFESLQAMCDEWADEYERTARDAPATLDPGLARDGVALFRSLPATADRNVLLCTDLHAGNVLAAQREPWLVIDPKPHVGDRTYDALQQCSTATPGSTPTHTACASGWLGSSNSTPNGSGCGCFPAASSSQSSGPHSPPSLPSSLREAKTKGEA